MPLNLSVRLLVRNLANGCHLVNLFLAVTFSCHRVSRRGAPRGRLMVYHHISRRGGFVRAGLKPAPTNNHIFDRGNPPVVAQDLTQNRTVPKNPIYAALRNTIFA